MAAEPIAKRARGESTSAERICKTAQSALDARVDDGTNNSGVALHKMLAEMLGVLIAYFQCWLSDAGTDYFSELQETKTNAIALLATASLLACGDGMADIVRTAAVFDPLFHVCQLLTSGLLKRAKKEEISVAVQCYRAATATCTARDMMLEFVSLYYGLCLMIDQHISAVLDANGWENFDPVPAAAAPVPAAAAPVPATADDLEFLRKTMHYIACHEDRDFVYFPGECATLNGEKHKCVALPRGPLVDGNVISPVVWRRLDSTSNLNVNGIPIGQCGKFFVRRRGAFVQALFIRESLLTDVDVDSSTDCDDGAPNLLCKGRQQSRAATDEDIAVVREVVSKILDHSDHKTLCVSHVLRRFNHTGELQDCIGLVVHRIKHTGILTPDQWKNFLRVARMLFHGETMGKTNDSYSAPGLPRGTYIYLVRRDVVADLPALCREEPEL